jgi:uncharacterized membrane protein YidH (DUF202 family)
LILAIFILALKKNTWREKMNTSESTMKHEKKLKIFGSNTTNFYGWIFTGILVFGIALYNLMLMGQATDQITVLKSGFSAIFIILGGIFALLLQSYHSKVSQDLFKNENKTHL